MNKLVIPSSPNWYEHDIMACASDNTVIYGSRNDIVVIKSTPDDEPDDVRIISRAHSLKLVSININRNWGQPHKLAVTVSEDKIIKLWNMETLEKKMSHNKHEPHTRVTGASFAGDDRVISVSEHGVVIVWNIIKNETNILSSLLDTKVLVTCMSVCPHATWLAAFGLKNGLVVVADLRKSGRVLYKLRGHDKAVVSLSWCPVAVNIFPIKPQNKVVQKIKEDALRIEEKTGKAEEKHPKSDILEVKVLKTLGEGNVKNNEETEISLNIVQKKREDTLKIEEIAVKSEANQPMTKDVEDKMLGTVEEGELKNIIKKSREDTFKIEDKPKESRPKSVVVADGELESVKEINIKNNEETVSFINEDPESKLSEEDKLNRRKQKYPKKANLWTDLKHADDDELETACVRLEELEGDFLKECDALRQRIIQASSPKDQESNPLSSCTTESAPRVILKSKRKKGKGSLADIVLFDSKQIDVESAIIPLEKVESKEKYDSPLDRRHLSMELCESLTKSTDILAPKMTSLSEVNMDITTCGRKDSSNTIDSAVSEKEAPVSSSGDKFTLDTAIGKSNKEDLRFSLVAPSDEVSDVKKHDNIGLLEVNEVFCEVESEDTNKEAKSLVENGDKLLDNVKIDSVCCSLEEKNGKEDLGNDKEGKNKGNVTIEENWRIREIVCEDEEPRKEFLLASSARESNIYIWRAGTDGRMQTFLTVPNKSNYKKSRYLEKTWITLCWVSPNILLSSSKTGELLQWNLPKPKDPTKLMRQVHKDHSAVLFSIKAPITYCNEYNFLEKEDTVNAWTIGRDRLLLNTEIRSKKNLSCYPCLGGSINCLAGSPLDPNRLAFGTSEGTLNMWDLSREHTKKIVFSNFNQKIASAVTCLAWHPNVELSLAWGTIEGRIGLVDTVVRSKPPKILPQFFKSQIYKIEWGPLTSDKRNMGLFVMSEGKVAIFDLKGHEKDPQILETPDNTSVYTMAWKPDFSVFLVSSKTGALITYTPDLNISHVCYLPQKLQSIVWHPDAVSDDKTVSKYCNTFVSVVKSTAFIVYDLGIESDNNEDKVMATFENRDSIINSIAWSPHCGSQLVLSDDAAVAQVYDIESKTVLATFLNPCLSNLLSVIWSPIDADYIIIGSISHNIIVWKVSENKPLTEKEITSHRNKMLKAQSKEVSDQLPKEQSEQTSKTDESKQKKSSKSAILPIFYAVREHTQVGDLRKLLQWKTGVKNDEPKIGNDRNVDVLQVFGEHKDMMKILDINVSSFRHTGKHQMGNMLSLWKGDINSVINGAIDEKRVNPWIISLCHMVSPTLWQKACETYTTQLMEEPDSDPFETVTYLLACHKVELAIKVLCDHELFREALALAKSRLGDDDPVINEILEKWAKCLVYQGSFEVAAECYICLGKFEEAASVLFRRSNIDLLELAVDLAKLSNNEELHKAVQFRFKAFKAEIEKCKGSKEKSIASNGVGNTDGVNEDKESIKLKDNIIFEENIVGGMTQTDFVKKVEKTEENGLNMDAIPKDKPVLNKNNKEIINKTEGSKVMIQDKDVQIEHIECKELNKSEEKVDADLLHKENDDGKCEDGKKQDIEPQCSVLSETCQNVHENKVVKKDKENIKVDLSLIQNIDNILDEKTKDLELQGFLSTDEVKSLLSKRNSKGNVLLEDSDEEKKCYQ